MKMGWHTDPPLRIIRTFKFIPRGLPREQKAMADCQGVHTSCIVNKLIYTISQLILDKAHAKASSGAYSYVCEQRGERATQYKVNWEMVLFGTEGRSRTDTVLPPPDFESGASTSFATPAQRKVSTHI